MFAIFIWDRKKQCSIKNCGSRRSRKYGSPPERSWSGFLVGVTDAFLRQNKQRYIYFFLLFTDHWGTWAVKMTVMIMLVGRAGGVRATRLILVTVKTWCLSSKRFFFFFYAESKGKKNPREKLNKWLLSRGSPSLRPFSCLSATTKQRPLCSGLILDTETAHLCISHNALPTPAAFSFLF